MEILTELDVHENTLTQDEKNFLSRSGSLYRL